MVHDQRRTMTSSDPHSPTQTATPAPDSRAWDQTRLFELLAKSPGSACPAVRAYLQMWMPRIQRVLRKAGTASTDFTLHDDDHSFRVAELMVQMMDPAVASALSPFELALLILSAYLHDIGMTPEQQRVRSLYHFLAFGAPPPEEGSRALAAAEAEDVQRFLDAWDHDGEALEPPLLANQSTAERHGLVEELVTHYARHRHNDWSREWIEAHLPDEPLEGYASWRSDLVLLCQSHHFGLAELRGADFNPKSVGPHPASTVHLRFLAALLRMADVLDLDPERTPSVVFEHRDIAPGSRIYWWKDHHVAARVDAEGVRVAATPLSAQMHRAVEATVDQIDAELRLCRMLDEQTHFDRLPWPGAGPHRWMLPVAAIRDIRPRGDAYTYIDATFRPNTRKLLELLAGTKLYRSQFDAVRELLQNALDAVKELIAVHAVTEEGIDVEQYRAAAAHTHHVFLRLRREGDGRVWLECSDTGIGMTQSIIREHFLVSGSRPPVRLFELERRCRTRGFSLDRTGQFGIGALSYFMIADCVELHTRRATAYGDDDGPGWKFTTGGVGSFGELRRMPRSREGTSVRLRLRPGVETDLALWSTGLGAYLQSTVRYVPCRVRVQSIPAEGDPVTLFEAAPGWAQSVEAWTREIVKAHAHHRWEGGSGPRRGEQELPKVIEEREEELRRVIRAGPIEEGALPNGMGRYRCFATYFDHAGHVSLLHPAPEVAPASPHGGAGAFGAPVDAGAYDVPRVSWRGMAVELGDPGGNGLAGGARRRSGATAAQARLEESARWGHESARPVLEVDFLARNAVDLSVHRADAILSPNGSAALAWAIERAKCHAADLTLSAKAGALWAVNAALAPTVEETEFEIPGPLYWWSSPVHGDESTFTLLDTPVAEPLNLHAVVPRGLSVPGSATLDGRPLRWRGRNLRLLARPDSMAPLGMRCFGEAIGRASSTLGIWCGDEAIQLLAVWEQFPEKATPRLTGTRFPPAWSFVHHIYGPYGSGRISNARFGHAFESRDSVAPDVLDVLDAIEHDSPDERVLAHVRQDRACAYSLLSRLIQYGRRSYSIDPETWTPEFVRAALGTFIYSNPDQLREGDRYGVLWISPSGELELVTITDDGAVRSEPALPFGGALPEPESDWIIQCG